MCSRVDQMTVFSLQADRENDVRKFLNKKSEGVACFATLRLTTS